MKKVFAILLLLFYLPATCGMAIHSFYCCGKLASAKIQFVSKAGTSDTQSKNDHCCDNVTHFFKVHDAQQPSVSNIAFHAPVLQLQAMVPAMNSVLGLIDAEYVHPVSLFGSPPLPWSPAMYIKHCTFLI